VLAYECKLTHDDLETMSIGMVLDHIDEFVEMKNPNKKSSNVVYADQSHFDAF